MPPLYCNPSDVRLAMRNYRVDSEAHIAALALLAKAETPDQTIVRYRAVLAAALKVRATISAMHVLLGLPYPPATATVQDLEGLVPDIIPIQEA